MTYKVTCHCGSVELAVDFPDGSSVAKRCNCSICQRKGAVMVYTARENLTVVRGADVLSTYTFHSGVAQHYFCSKCGIYTHHVPRINPKMFGINAGCIEGLEIDEVELIDGQNHPMDR